MSAYPVQVAVPAPGHRSRLLAAFGILFPLKLLLALPAWVVLSVATMVGSLLAWITYGVVLVTGRIPPALAQPLAAILGWSTGFLAWFWGLTDRYPIFSTSQGSDGVDLTVEPPGRRSRLLALLGVLFALKSILLLPGLIVVYVLSVVGAILAWVGYWAVLATGTLPAGLHGFLTGTLRWNVRLVAWLWGLTDRYPPFSLGD
jgi:hypothetical protein